MPSLGRTAVHALSALVVVCASPSAAEPTTIALLRPHPISPITPSPTSGAASLTSAPPVVKLAKIAFEC
jgi:hypothetical protein